MQAALKDKNDIKIFILYLMKNIGYPLDFPTINDIVVQDELVNYFDFAECFADLMDNGNIAESKNENGEEVYFVTEQGKQVSDSLESDLMMMIREKSLKSALRLLSFRKRGAKISCKTEVREDGKYLLSCSITEKGKELLSFDIADENKRRIEQMALNFEDRPETIYRGMLTLLTGEINYLIN